MPKQLFSPIKRLFKPIKRLDDYGSSVYLYIFTNLFLGRSVQMPATCFLDSGPHFSKADMKL
jgi:hypothetical protein